MIISVTGHRPTKLNQEYDMRGPCTEYLRNEFERIMIHYKADRVISGMALGVDTIWALTAISLGIPVTAAIPFKGQESRWPQRSQKRFNRILSSDLVDIKVVSSGAYTPWKMQSRNIWMCDNSDMLIACWNGDQNGGTFNCIKYAEKVGMEIHIVDPNGWRDRDEKDEQRISKRPEG